MWHADTLATQKDGDKQGGRGRLHIAARDLEVSPELYLVLWEQMWKLLEKAESITLTWEFMDQAKVDWDPSPLLCNIVSDRETEIAIHASGEATIPELRAALQCTSSSPANTPQAAHLIIDLTGLGC